MDFPIPDTLYRGHGTVVTDTMRALPTFTDVIDIAEVYASDQPLGQVDAVRLSIKNPMILGILNEEDVVEIAHIKESLKGLIDDEKIEAWIKAQSFWRFDGDWVNLAAPPEKDFDGNAFNRERCYTDTFRVADSITFLELAKEAGFDGYVYRGTFTSDDQFQRPIAEIMKNSSYDDASHSSLEYRPFTNEQIEVLKLDRTINRGLRPAAMALSH